MAKYKVKSEFVYRDRRISPKDTREWTPPSEEVAERLVRAGCLKRVEQSPPEVKLSLAADTFSRASVVGLMEQINKAQAEQPPAEDSSTPVEPPPAEPPPSKNRRRKK